MLHAVRRPRISLAAVSIGLLLIGFSHLPAQQVEPSRQEVQRPQDALTPAERELAGRIALEFVRENQLLTVGQVFLVDVELVRAKEGTLDPAARQALVTHYRYDGDLALLTLVDLAREVGVSVDTVRHLAVPLSETEFENARRLALADDRLARILAPYESELRVEALLTQAQSTDDPWYGHRVVRLLFHVGTGYLDEPVVYVDLTAEDVIIEEPGAL